MNRQAFLEKVRKFVRECERKNVLKEHPDYVLSALVDWVVKLSEDVVALQKK